MCMHMNKNIGIVVYNIAKSNIKYFVSFRGVLPCNGTNTPNDIFCVTKNSYCRTNGSNMQAY